LLGRFRNLDKFFTPSATLSAGSLKGMRNRRAINTPIQGGAADIVIAAMVNLNKNK
jgi:DNA polymerase-1